MSLSPAATSEKLFTRDKAVEYCRSRGLEKVTANTIVRAAYYSEKLHVQESSATPPIGLRAHWTAGLQGCCREPAASDRRNLHREPGLQ
jgi:hypothetical protein